jgi:hypothetical protein
MTLTAEASLYESCCQTEKGDQDSGSKHPGTLSSSPGDGCENKQQTEKTDARYRSWIRRQLCPMEQDCFL